MVKEKEPKLMINGTKLIKALRKLMKQNDKFIDKDMDGDDECSHENATLDNIIFMIESGKYNTK